jgi:hypothetical protein
MWLSMHFIKRRSNYKVMKYKHETVAKEEISPVGSLVMRPKHTKVKATEYIKSDKERSSLLIDIVENRA